MTYKNFGIMAAILFGGILAYLYVTVPSPEIAATPSTDSATGSSIHRSDQHRPEQGFGSAEVESNRRTQLEESTDETGDASYHPIEEKLIIDTSNTLNEYINDENGFPVKVIDNDAASFSYRKPLKLIQYTEGKVTSLTSYQYFEGETVVTTLSVAYGNDGAIEDYNESVEFRIIQ